MKDQDDQFEFDNQFDNLREDDDFLLEDDDANEALKDIEIDETEDIKKVKGNFAQMDMSAKNSEESDGELDFEESNKNDFKFSNQNKSKIGGGSYSSKL
jgi:hypothetical protein